MWSIRPTPWRPAILFSSWISSTPSQVAAVQGDRPAALESDLDLLGLVGGLAGVDGPLVGLGRRLDPGVFEDTRLDRAAPEVLVGAEDRLLGRLDLDAVLGRVLQLLGPGPLPLADRCDDLQARGRGSGTSRRTGPGRSPCPCSRAPRPRRHGRGRPGPSTGRSAGVPAPWPADICPRRARPPSARGRRSSRRRGCATSSAIASTAPVRSAFSRIAWMSCPWPRSQV